MKITKIVLNKTESSTIGYLDQNNRTRFKKVQAQFGVEATPDKGEDMEEARKKVSEFVNNGLIQELK